MTGPTILEGAPGGILLLCDHASAAVPSNIDLGISPDLLGRHIAVDIGADALTRRLSARLGVPAVLGHVSRLVIDLHRPPDHPDLIPQESDGHAVPGNVGADRAERLHRFHRPYHRVIAQTVGAVQPALIVAIHSFTRQLETASTERPWHVGILYNRDRRAADLLLDALEKTGVLVGDNQPYSGRVLNTTLNRHGEANGIPAVSIEVRNDLIADDLGIDRWTALLTGILPNVRNRLAREGSHTQ